MPTEKGFECVACKAKLGDASGVLPFTAHDGEVWCPQCFVWHRIPLEPERYPPECFSAVKCSSPKCGVVSVAIGHGNPRCGQCGWVLPVILGPKIVA